MLVGALENLWEGCKRGGPSFASQLLSVHLLGDAFFLKFLPCQGKKGTRRGEKGKRQRKPGTTWEAFPFLNSLTLLKITNSASPSVLAHRNRSDCCDLRLRCPSQTPEIAPISETRESNAALRFKGAMESR